MEKTDNLSKQLELNSLIEFSQLINSNLDLKFILGNILLPIMGKMMIGKGLMLIKKNPDKKDDIYCVGCAKGIKLLDAEQEIEFEFPKSAYFESSELPQDDNFFVKNDLRYFFKVYFDNKLLGVLCLGKKINPKDSLSKSEIIFIETLLNLSSSSIENTIKFSEIKRLNDELSNKLTQLNSLFELSKEFNSNFLEKDKVLKLLGFTLLGNLGIKDFVIFTKYKSDKFYLLYSNKKLDLEGHDLSILERVKLPVFLNASHENSLIKFLASKNYELIVPTINDNEVQNIICLGKKLNKTGYNQSDIEYLSSIINLSVMSIENAMLFGEFLEKQQMESELRIAREIQVGLLPKEIPQVKNYDISAVNIPAMHVGGDYYDIIKLNDKKTAFVIADVSGKGTPAALLMANIQSAVHSFLKVYDENTFDISDITLKINELIYENTTPEKFITFFWGILDNETHKFEYINAGHNHPVIIRDGKVEVLDKGGLMIGVMNFGLKYESGEIGLNEKDLLVLYTDGVTEAQDEFKNEYGEDALINLLQERKNEKCKDIVIHIKTEVENFSKNCKQFDDITIISLKRN
ncbi:MAG TPA: PP2C family protein-serine/threonine phosphatase [Ignavibacteria bacterium]|nr:PP2C family protein-serine/threonine phosphatase [Ignavibacteria bacterium]